MATTTTTKKSTPVVKEDQTDTLKKENEQLRNDMESMKAQMEEMMKQMSSIAQLSALVGNTAQNQGYIDKDIEVVSLVPGQLVLSTNGRSDGKIYAFEKQFEEQMIPVADLKAICSSMKTTAMNGKFFINDAEFVREVGLSSSYRNILDKAKLHNVLSMPANDFIDTFKRIPKAQKNIVSNMIKDKRFNGEFVDANIMMALKDLTGVDYTSIEKLPEEYDKFKEV